MSSIADRLEGISGRRRGVVGDDRPPLSTAVVIGLGGSGIQTISRIRSAVYGDRPDAAAEESIRFLGIDAVEVTNQVPPLPPGVTLATSEYLNITGQPFNPAQFVRVNHPVSPDLKNWWDPNYDVPATSLTQGLKRERMLGRLAFYNAAHDIVAAISNTMAEALAIQQEHVARGIVGGRGGSLHVYVVGSASGGTGSAGFLDVLHRIHLAANQLGVIPEIRAFLYLPGVFRYAVSKGAAPQLERQAHESNAYAFFRELDHFVVRSDRLDEENSRPSIGSAQLTPGSLLKQVYCIDSVLGSQGVLNRVQDLYEIAAEAIYSFLLTDGGRPHVGAASTNVDALLQTDDVYGKRRIYCSLGVSRIVFPGDTLRRHLRHRYADAVITHGLLYNPLQPTVHQLVRDSDVVEGLKGLLKQRISDVGRPEQPDEVRRVLSMADRAAVDLDDEPTSDMATQLYNAVERDVPTAERAAIEAVELASRAILPTVRGLIADRLNGAGMGINFSIEALKELRKLLVREQELAVNDLSRANQTKDQQYEILKAARDHLADLSARFVVMPGKRRAVAAEVADALREWAYATIKTRTSEGVDRFLDEVRSEVDRMSGELDAAREHLGRTADELQKRWQDDDLVGKDAGPRDTTTLIPSDVQPEVEKSEIAVRLGDQIVSEVTGTIIGDELATMITRWCEASGTEGPFDLGSANGDVRARAQEGLGDRLLAMANDRALRAGGRERLPRDLIEAADTTPGGQDTLRRAMAGLASLSRQTCWSLSPGKVQAPAGADTPPPTTSTVIMCHPSTRDLVMEIVGDASIAIEDGRDPEKVTALSIEWGAPLHAVGPVEAWQRTYDAARAHRHQPPAHLSTHWEEERRPLSQLVPRYYVIGEIWRLVAMAMTASAAIRAARSSGAPWLGDLFAGRTDTIDVPLQLATTLDTATWTGVRHGRIDGLFVTEEVVELGDDVTDLPDALGVRMGLQSAMHQVIEAVLGRLTGEEVDEALTTTRTKLERLLEGARAGDEEETALKELLNTLDGWEARIRRIRMHT
jgi:hypothetical protein